MREAGILISQNGNILYSHTPHGRTVGSLPDSVDLWSVFWENRRRLLGFAHSHPGSGVPAPSWTDLTTFAAIEAGLGRRLSWWITSSTHVIEVRYEGPEKYDYKSAVVVAPWWSEHLHKISK